METVSQDRRRERRRRFWQRLAITTLLATVALTIVRVWPRPPLSAGVPQSVEVVDRHGRLLRLALASDQRYRLWTPLAQVSPTLVDAVQLHEDAWFRWHPGVNPVALVRAVRNAAGDGPRLGASTLTMQLARLRWRLETRTPGGKLRQIARALQLEATYSKDAILEAYLNLAPYGGNIEGVGAASRIYFRKSADALTLPEALTLAVLPQAPSRRGRLQPLSSTEAQASTGGAGLQAARARLYERWRQRHGSDAASDALMHLPLRLHAPHELPFRAPHAVDRLLADRARHADTGPRLASTLDLRLQALAEERVEAHLRRWRARGVRNAAVMLVDRRDQGVRALVGSADFFDAGIHGQVDGSAGKRSPGSTLKPFLYALALDQGVLHPATVLRDVPTAFGPYTPENFDGRFLGPVTAQDALIRSRNIPAVWVSSQLQRPGFYDFLRQAGVSRLASEQHYGLALVLGGGEVSMAELARMYSMLGNDGRLRALRWRENDPADAGTPLLSPEAAFVTRDMLRHNPRPDSAGGDWGGGGSAPPVAWKTGTSWGFHDAWTAGEVGPYVLVVWLGNFDGRPNPALVGVEAAAPLFFSIVDGLRAAGVDLTEPPASGPLNLKRVAICRASGELPNAECPQRGTTWFLPGKSPIRVSTIHRTVLVDRRSGRVACGRFDPETMRREVHEFWPSDLARVFAQAGIPRRPPPPGADCAGLADDGSGSPPRITSPWRATHYALRLSHPEQSHLSLVATVDADVVRQYWFAGDSFIGSAAAGESLAWTPDRAGQWTLSVVDDHGRHDSRQVDVTVER
ncbi:MAG: penicillin-binding protein 1C [Arenimonas sp.]